MRRRYPVGRVRAASRRRRPPRVAIIGAGFGGLATRGGAAPCRLRGLRDSREGRRRRRHLVPQSLPRLRLRHPLAPLLVLLRAQAGLVAALRPASPDLAYLEHLRREVRPAAFTAASATQGAARLAGTGKRRRSGRRSRFDGVGFWPSTLSADVVVSAVGLFAAPRCCPQIEGLADFTGPRWCTPRGGTTPSSGWMLGWP